MLRLAWAQLHSGSPLSSTRSKDAVTTRVLRPMRSTRHGATGPTGRRPSKVASCLIWTDFDEGLHGWRAWGDMRGYDVDWRAQAPVLVPSDPVLR